MNLHRMEQYSDEWWALRRGRITASVASKVITPTGKKSTQFKSEVGRLIAEALELQEPEDKFSSEWMERGSDTEAEARRWFSVEKNLDLMEIGMVTSGDRLGASPDALTGYEPHPIPCEIKVPKPSTHIEWLLKGGLPAAHKPQVHFQMVVCDAPHAWFMSYSPGIEPLIEKVERDEYTENLKTYLEEAAVELDEAFIRIAGDNDGKV